LGGARQLLAVGADRLGLAGVFLALLHERRLGRAGQGLAVLADRLDLAGLRHRGGAESEGGNNSCNKNPLHVSSLPKSSQWCALDNGICGYSSRSPRRGIALIGLPMNGK